MIGLQESVTERFAPELAHLPAAEANQVIAARTAELAAACEQIAHQTQLALQRDWQATHGHAPGYLEQTALIQRSRQIATDTVLAQLWEGYRDPDDEPGAQVATAMQMWPDTPWTPDATIEQRVAELWPQHQQNLGFVVLAELLLDARERDALSIPERPDEPLTAQLEAIVLDKQRALDGVG